MLVSAASGIVVAFFVWRRGDASPVPPWQDVPPGQAFAEDATAEQLNAVTEKMANALTERFPDEPAALHVLARWKYVSGDLREASNLWSRCVELDPTFGGALYALAVVALEQDRAGEAVDFLERLRLLAPEDVRVPVLLAEGLVAEDRVEEARIVLEDHVARERASAEAMVGLGDIYLRLARPEEAIRAYEIAVASTAEHGAALYGLGRAYAAAGDQAASADALRRFERVAETRVETESDRAKGFLDRDSSRIAAAQAHDDAGEVYERLGDLPLAEELWRKAVFLDPGNVRYWRRLFALYRDQGDRLRALQVAEKIASLSPHDVNAWLNLAVLHAESERPDDALRAVETAIRLEPNNPRCREARKLVNTVQ